MSPPDTKTLSGSKSHRRNAKSQVAGLLNISKTRQNIHTMQIDLTFKALCLTRNKKVKGRKFQAYEFARGQISDPQSLALLPY